MICDSGTLEASEQRRFEAHRQMIDLQIPLDGPEIIEIYPTDQLTGSEAYDTEKDLIFFDQPSGTVTSLYVQPGEVVVLYPEDGHKPCVLPAGAQDQFRKLVFKVAID